MRRLNRFVEETQPWVLAKDEADPERLDEVLYNLVEGLRVTTLLLVPYLPRSSETLLAALGEEGRELAELGSRPGGQSVERIPALFPKIDSPSDPRFLIHAVRDSNRGLLRGSPGRAGPGWVRPQRPSSGRARRGSSSAPLRRPAWPSSARPQT